MAETNSRPIQLTQNDSDWLLDFVANNNNNTFTSLINHLLKIYKMEKVLLKFGILKFIRNNLNRFIFLGTILMFCAGTSLSAQNYQYLKFTVNACSNFKIIELNWLSGSNNYPAIDLTSNNSGGVVASGSFKTTSYKAFDGIATDAEGLWVGTAAPKEIVLDLGTPIMPTGIQIQKMHWNDLQSFTCYGSNDGTNWMLLFENNFATGTWTDQIFNFDGVVPQTTYTLTTNATHGSVSKSPDKPQYTEGETVSLTATPDPGYQFDTWGGDVSGTSQSITVTMDADNNVTANFSQYTGSYYNLTVTNGSGDGSYMEGAVVDISADPAPQGQVFDVWTGDTTRISSLSRANTTITIQGSDVTIQANYKATPSKTMQMGTNFWFLITWSDETPMIPSNQIDWATAYSNGDNIWDPVFIDEISIYEVFRFMDWGATNNNAFSDWDLRLLPTDPKNHPEAKAIGYTKHGSNVPGLAYEWMIDLCNRTHSDMWICLPHMTSNSYWANLADLILEKLDPSLKCYVEYSNETWNGAFDQNVYIIEQGEAMGFPGSNEWYKAGAFHVYKSFQLFEEFENKFTAQGRRDNLVKVMAVGGNIGPVRTAMRENLPLINPLDQWPDAWSIAPYIGHNIDGASPTVFDEVEAELALQIDPENGGWQGNGPGRVLEARQLADEFGLDLIAYEGGSHQLTNAAAWATNPEIYTHYTHMLDIYADYFDLFCHYAHCAPLQNGKGQGSWGAVEYTGQPISEAHKYRALSDWVNANTDKSAQSVTAYPSVNQENSLNIYPNPASGDYLFVDNEAGDYTRLLITDLTGKLLISKNIVGEKVKISTSDLTRGMYIISLENDKTIKSAKLIIE